MAMRETYRFLKRRWWLVLTRGVLALIFGFAMVAWGLKEPRALVLLFGLFSVVDGLIGMAGAFGHARGGGRWPWLAGEGGIAFLIGFLMLAVPPVSAPAFFLTVAIRAALTGLLLLLVAFRLDRRPGQRPLMASALVSLAFAGLLFFAPAFGLRVMAWWVGLWVIVAGAFFLAIAAQFFGALREGATEGR